MPVVLLLWVVVEPTLHRPGHCLLSIALTLAVIKAGVPTGCVACFSHGLRGAVPAALHSSNIGLASTDCAWLDFTMEVKMMMMQENHPAAEKSPQSEWTLFKTCGPLKKAFKAFMSRMRQTS